MKKRFFAMVTALLLLVLLPVMPGAAQEEPKDTWVLAINATFPPFESIADSTDEYVGIDIDIANYIAKKLGVNLEIHDMQFSALVPTMQSGRADMILSGISPTQERLQVLDFSDSYYYPMNAIICQEGAGYDALEDLKGKTIGVSMGTSYADLAHSVEDAQVMELDSTPLVIQDIQNGRCDAGIFDSTQAGVFVQQNPGLEMHIIESEVTREDSFAVALPKGSEYVDDINEILAEMMDDGTFHDILVKYIGEDSTAQYEEMLAKITGTQEEEAGEASTSLLDFSVLTSYLPMLGRAVLLTLEFTILSTVLGFLLGIVLSLIKISHLKLLKGFADLYTSIFRGTPLLVQLMLIYYATPQLFDYQITALQAGVLTFGLNSAAYISESIRGGILSVDRGQWEAGMALGIPKARMMVNIIFPQAFKNTLPSLVNESIALLKDSSMVSIIGVADTMRWASLIQARTFRAFEAFIVAALVYYVLVMLLTSLGKYLERKVRVSD